MKTALLSCHVNFGFEAINAEIFASDPTRYFQLFAPGDCELPGDMSVYDGNKHIMHYQALSHTKCHHSSDHSIKVSIVD